MYSSEKHTKPEKYFKSSRCEMLEFLPNKVEKVLDIGCGSGNFGAIVKKEFKAEIWGIEVNSDAAELAKEHIDRVFVGDIYEVISQIPKSYFDCIVCNDILEHLVDPSKLLHVIKENLSKRGVVVCSIPNIRFIQPLYNLLLRKQWEYEEEGVLDKTHLRFFTEKSIKNMFHALNYEILKMKGINRADGIAARILNILSFGFMSDTLYMQFGCQVKPKT